MTLHFEILAPGKEEVMRTRVFQPGEGSTLSNNLPDGERELLIFGCAFDNTHSTLERSQAHDVRLTRTERWVPFSRDVAGETVLSPNEPLTISVVTDRGNRAV